MKKIAVGNKRLRQKQVPPPAASRRGQAKPHTTLKRIADQLDVSMSTVSRVLSGQARRHRISTQTETAVSNLARQFNFVPNQLARGLRLKKTLTIGLVIPDLSNPFFAGIAHQVALGARQHDYSVLLCDSHENIDLEVQALGLLRHRHVEGLVLCPVGTSAAHLEDLVQAQLPIVLVDRYFPDLSLPYVAADNLTGAHEGTELLIGNGHRCIACLQGVRGTSPNEFRVRGYQQALARHRLPVDASLIVGDSFGEQSGYIETKLLLRNRKDVTAIFAFSNLLALGALRALAEEHRRIPDDISIIAFDDQPYAAYLATPMTTVAQPFSEMGDVAVKLLFDQIQSPEREPTGGILLPTNLIIRRSVKKITC
jgi:LacI family transcriptional regulator